MKKITSIKNCVSVVSLITMIYSCSAPRAITDSGKVTPKNQVKIGGNYSANIPTLTIKNTAEVIDKAINYVNSDNIKSQNIESFANSVSNSSIYDEQYRLLNKYALSYFLDPLTVGVNYYARYGVMKRVEIGYQYSSGTNAFDAKYQFLGSTGTIGKGEKTKQIYGSIGLQYAYRNYKLPFSLDKIQEKLGLEFKRKDIFIPIIFSKSFGAEEKIGHISWGVAYNHTFINYGFNPKNLHNQQTEELLSSMYYKKNFSSVGAFVNIKVGYKFVYFLASVSAFYQNYGKFTLLDDSQVNLSGYTIVPSIGLQFVIPPLHKSHSVKS